MSYGSVKVRGFLWIYMNKRTMLSKRETERKRESLTHWQTEYEGRYESKMLGKRKTDREREMD